MFVCGECGWAQPTPGRCNDGTTLVSIGDDLLLGTNLGPYRIARLLGVGGMGRVYKGVHPQIGSRVAVKVLSRECTDRPDLVERFFAEARTVNVVSHEGIVNVLDLSVLPDGRPYIVMEYLDGAPLSAIIDAARARGVPLPVGSIARLAVEVLDALAAAHGKGVVHRDLKPDNIFITPGGRPKVLDFGIAKLQPELGGNSATHTGSLLGTPQYMAPEQASGRPVDARADLYALGCILYECLTLQRPFHAESLFDLLRKQIEEPVRPPRELRPDLPPDVEHVLLIALSKLPEQRFGTATAMSQALQHATAQLPPEQWAPITPTGSMAPARANPSWGARPSPQPSLPLPQPLPNGSLARAGTVPSDPNLPPQHTPTPPPPAATSHVGRYLVLAALVLVGGGVAVAVIVTHGSAETAPAMARTDEAPAPAKAKHPARPARTAGSDDDSDDDVDDVDKQIDRETAKILKDVDRQFATAEAAMAAPPPHPAPAPAPTPTPIAAGAPPPPATTAGAPATDELHTPDGWIVRHELAPPAGYDPRAADVDAFVRFALGEAKRAIPDAQLTRIDADNVDATGHADLSLPSFAAGTGTITVRFVSAVHMPPDPKAHKPFGFEWRCEFRVEADPERIEIRGDAMKCDEAPLRAPRCGIADIWKRFAAKVPAGKTRADFNYRVRGEGLPTWEMAIKGALEETMTDTCKG